MSWMVYITYQILSIYLYVSDSIYKWDIGNCSHKRFPIPFEYIATSSLYYLCYDIVQSILCNTLVYVRLFEFSLAIYKEDTIYL